MMILTATEERGRIVFRDEGFEVFYEMDDSSQKFEGNAQEQAEQIVKEYIKCKLVRWNRTESGCGWASNYLQKIDYRLARLREFLMDILVNEARLQICFREKQNGTDSDS